MERLSHLGKIGVEIKDHLKRFVEGRKQEHYIEDRQISPLPKVN